MRLPRGGELRFFKMYYPRLINSIHAKSTCWQEVFSRQPIVLFSIRICSSDKAFAVAPILFIPFFTEFWHSGNTERKPLKSSAAEKIRTPTQRIVLRNFLRNKRTVVMIQFKTYAFLNTQRSAEGQMQDMVVLCRQFLNGYQRHGFWIGSFKQFAD